VGKHVGGRLVAPYLPAEDLLQFAAQAEVWIVVLRRRRTPLLVAPRQPRAGVADRNAANGGPLQTGAARVARLRVAIHQHRDSSSLIAAGHVQNRRRSEEHTSEVQ